MRIGGPSKSHKGGSGWGLKHFIVNVSELQHVINKLDFFVVGVPLKASYDKYTQQSVHGYLNERE